MPPKRINKQKSPEKSTEETEGDNDQQDANTEASSDPMSNLAETSPLDMPSTMDLLKAIQGFKQDFHSQMGEMMSAIREAQLDIQSCSGRIGEAEKRISDAEDEITSLKEEMENLRKTNKVLNNKVEDLEARSRRNNIRILGVPEKEEPSDSCSFFEKWIADTLKITSPVLERAHRITTSQRSSNTPRTVIVKCLNYRDRENIMNAAKVNKELTYKGNRIRFLPDLPTEVYRRQRQYDGVRKRLREYGWNKHRIIYPAKLLLTNDDNSSVFETPAEVDAYIKKMKLRPVD